MVGLGLNQGRGDNQVADMDFFSDYLPYHFNTLVNVALAAASL
jgi:hypothetical protein